MPLAIASRLGPYEILRLLGSGGMGEVYEARDTRLDRTVAVKVLLEAAIGSENARERFQREARVVSSLNHPYICTLYDVGHQNGRYYLVMEYVAGETLADRMKRGPVPLEQALSYAIQMAEALDVAHRHGVVHRDLKPGNIMLTNSGVKLLDFGLAKTHERSQTSNVTASLTIPITQEGVLLGTLQYMAPEQVEGQPADARADLFALGAVLYEMLTGKSAFEGRSRASLIASILTTQPPAITSLQPVYPVALERLIDHCLTKNREQRWQNAGDLGRALSSIRVSLSAVTAPAGSKRTTKRALLLWGSATAVLIMIAAISYALAERGATRQASTVILEFGLPDPEMLINGIPRLSPDGRHLAIVAEGRGGSIPSLWVRSMDSPRARELPGTQGAYDAFWSPDSHQLAFYSQEELRKVSLDGGSPQTICQVRSGQGGSWSRDDVILFSRLYGAGIERVPAAGGEARVVTAIDASRGETRHFFPHFLADNKHFLYTAASTHPEHQVVRVRSLDSGEDRALVRSRTNAEVSGGYVLFARGSSLMAQPFDENKHELRAEARTLTDAVRIDDSTVPFIAPFSTSGDGLLAYRSSQREYTTRLVWYDRHGKRLANVAEPAHYTNPALSPDGSRLLTAVTDQQTGMRDIWMIDLVRGGRSRLTFHPADESNPTWSPDGSRIAFTSSRKGGRDIYWMSASRVGEEKPVIESPLVKHLEGWSGDGQWLYFHNADDIYRVAATANDPKPERVVAGTGIQERARVSPNGKWLAYTSDESGRYEVYAQPLTPEGGRVQISTETGTEPFWRSDGKEIFFVQGSALMAVEVKEDASGLVAGVPKRLFEAPFTPEQFRRNRYVVAADGTRFLLITAAQAQQPDRITVVVNWPGLLKR